MDEDTIKEEGLKPLLEILHQVADLFPVEEYATHTRTTVEQSSSEELSDALIFLYNLGLSPLVAVGAGADDKDPDTVVVQATPPWRIGLPAKDYYKNSEVVKKYTTTIAEILEKLYPAHKRENTPLHGQEAEAKGQGKIAAMRKGKNYAHDLVELETRLASASPDAEDMGDVTVSSNACNQPINSTN